MLSIFSLLIPALRRGNEGRPLQTRERRDKTPHTHSSQPTPQNTTIISQVLDGLTDTSQYDKRIRPNYGQEPVDVGVRLRVASISDVNEVDMDFTLNINLRQVGYESTSTCTLKKPPH
jgi:hypothetical protein